MPFETLCEEIKHNMNVALVLEEPFSVGPKLDQGRFICDQADPHSDRTVCVEIRGSIGETHRHPPYEHRARSASHSTSLSSTPHAPPHTTTVPTRFSSSSLTPVTAKATASSPFRRLWYWLPPVVNSSPEGAGRLERLPLSQTKARWGLSLWILSWVMVVIALLTLILQWGATTVPVAVMPPNVSRVTYPNDQPRPAAHYEYFKTTKTGTVVTDVAGNATPLNASSTGTVDPSGALVLSTSQTWVGPTATIPTQFTIFAYAKYVLGGTQQTLLTGKRSDNAAMTWYAGWNAGQVGVSNWNGVAVGANAAGVTGTDWNVVAVKNEPDTPGTSSYPATNPGSNATFTASSWLNQNIIVRSNSDGTVFAVNNSRYWGASTAKVIFYRYAGGSWTAYPYVFSGNMCGWGCLTANGNSYFYRVRGTNNITEMYWTGSGYAERSGNALTLASVNYMEDVECSDDGNLVVSVMFVGSTTVNAYLQVNNVYSVAVSEWSNYYTAGSDAVMFPAIDRQNKLAFGAWGSANFYSWHRANTSTTTWAMVTTPVPVSWSGHPAARPISWNSTMTRVIFRASATNNVFVYAFDYTQASNARFTLVATLPIVGDVQGAYLDGAGTIAAVSIVNGSTNLFYMAQASDSWTLRLQSTAGFTPALNGVAVAGDSSRTFFAVASTASTLWVYNVEPVVSPPTNVVRTYVNGVGVSGGSSPDASSGDTANYQLTLNLCNPAQASDLQLRELRVYNSFLTAAQIQAISTEMASPVIVPYNIAYNTLVGFVGQAITPLTATASGSAPTSVTGATVAALGLTLNQTTGAISGTPTTASYSVHTLTWSNAAGDTAVNVTVHIYDAPSFSYSGTHEYVVGVPATLAPVLIPEQSAEVLWSTFQITPALPTGFVLDAATGVIQVNTAEPLSESKHTASASVGGYQSTVTASEFTLSVVNFPTFSYPAPLSPGYVGYSTTLLTPVVNFNASSYSLSPAAPAGLQFDTTLGTWSGTPQTVTATASYTVTVFGYNTGATVAPVAFEYAVSAAPTWSYPDTTLSLYASYAWSGWSVASNFSPSGFSVSPTLPNGLAVQGSTGALTGTPLATAATQTYIFTASQGAPAGTAFPAVDVALTVLAAPTLTYPSATSVAYVNLPLSWAPSLNFPSQYVTSYSVSPTNLPAGLAFNTVTGVLSGTPTAAYSPATTYTVTVHGLPPGTAASTTCMLEWYVNDEVALGWPVSADLTWYVGQPLNVTPTINFPSSNITTWTLTNGVLPTGMTFNTSSGAWAGTPSVSLVRTMFTLTAVATPSVAPLTVYLTVVTPTLTYSFFDTHPLQYVGQPVAVAPSNVVFPTGYTVTVSPALPGDVSLNPTTGALLGTWFTAATARSYTFTVSGDAPSAHDLWALEVRAVPTLSVANSAAIVGQAYTSPWPQPSTTADAYTYHGTSLPAGLSFSSTTGMITGTWTSVTTWTCSFSYVDPDYGTVNSNTVSIQVLPAEIPSNEYLDYESNASHIAIWFQNYADVWLDVPRQRLMPLHAQYYEAFTVTPALPVGLNLNPTNGTIQGVPVVMQTVAQYAVTAIHQVTQKSFTTSVFIEVRATQLTQLNYATDVWLLVGSAVTIPPSQINGAALTFELNDVWPAGFSVDSVGVVAGRIAQPIPERAGAYVAAATFNGVSRSNGITLKPFQTFGVIANIDEHNTEVTQVLSLTQLNVLPVGDALVLSVAWDGTLSNFQCEPALPADLRLNSQTGEIRGRVRQPVAPTTYVITAEQVQAEKETTTTAKHTAWFGDPTTTTTTRAVLLFRIELQLSFVTMPTTVSRRIPYLTSAVLAGAGVSTMVAASILLSP